MEKPVGCCLFFPPCPDRAAPGMGTIALAVGPGLTQKALDPENKNRYFLRVLAP